MSEKTQAGKESAEGIPRKTEGSLSIGARLRAAREANSMSVEEVAQALHLDKSLVIALENDDREHLPEPVFVKGYIRHYAHLVGIQPETLAPHQDEPVVDSEGFSAKESATHKRDFSYQAPGNRWAPLFVGFIILVLIGLSAWWLTRPKHEAIPASVLEKSTSRTGGALSLSARAATATTLPAVHPAASSTSSAVAIPSNGIVGSTRMQIVNGQHTATPITPLKGTSPSGTEAAQAENRSSQVHASASFPPQSATNSINPAPAQNGKAASSLQVKLTGKSWVQVTDAKGHVLMLGLFNAGTHRELNGSPPYSVILGNAQGVSLFLGGNSIDDSAYIQPNRTARFVILPNGKTRP